jgi:hypothetical protein
MTRILISEPQNYDANQTKRLVLDFLFLLEKYELFGGP